MRRGRCESREGEGDGDGVVYEDGKESVRADRERKEMMMVLDD